MNRATVQILAVVVLFLGLSMGARAQSASNESSAGRPPHVLRRMGPGSFAFDRIVGGFGGKVVTNAPFSAEVTRTMNQALSDGTQINRTEKGSIARDSAGRTRREMLLSNIGPLSASGQVPHIVFIRDSAAGKGYILNENKKTAVTIDLPVDSNREARSAARMKMNEHFKESEQHQSLGTKTVDGLTLDGTLYTRTIPAGRIGNNKPITITTEEWYSPQLQMVVSRVRKDPRFGTTTYQLTNINLNEPSQSMFMVPPDYTPAQGRMWMKRKNASGGTAAPLQHDRN